MLTEADMPELLRMGWSGCLHDSDCACSNERQARDVQIEKLYVKLRDEQTERQRQLTQLHALMAGVIESFVIVINGLELIDTDLTGMDRILTLMQEQETAATVAAAGKDEETHATHPTP